MRFGDERESSNFEDATGRSGGFGGGFGGGNLGCLIPLVASRFGIGGVVVLLIGYFVLSSLGGLGGGGGIAPSSQQVGSSQGSSTLDPAIKHFSLQVLASTEDVWSSLLQPKGIRYTPTTLVFYSRNYSSGCGAAQSAMGPFYCPTDKKIYLDTEFFTELSQRFRAPGDFAQAYVIAHEVGHHVQDLSGRLDQANHLQARASQTEGNAIQVKVELQADCYAGVWAANAKDPEGRPVMEQGDFEEGMRAAEAIGDDTLQRETQGTVVPDSFTHGTSAQRMEALQRGFKSGDPAVCEF
ncbi:MAG TPA: neutral zinc metallopeptidase [Sphingomicrobium sp.]|nr:neutral zinc metallopeptidase [Sphingomicrobium sp.]